MCPSNTGAVRYNYTLSLTNLLIKNNPGNLCSMQLLSIYNK